MSLYFEGSLCSLPPRVQITITANLSAKCSECAELPTRCSSLRHKVLPWCGSNKELYGTFHKPLRPLSFQTCRFHWMHRREALLLRAPMSLSREV